MNVEEFLEKRYRSIKAIFEVENMIIIRGNAESGKSNTIEKLFNEYTFENQVFHSGCSLENREMVLKKLFSILDLKKEINSICYFFDEFDDISSMETIISNISKVDKLVITSKKSLSELDKYKNFFNIIDFENYSQDKFMKNLEGDSSDLEIGDWFFLIKNEDKNFTIDQIKNEKSKRILNKNLVDKTNLVIRTKYCTEVTVTYFR